MNDHLVQLRAGTDTNHGLQHRGIFGGFGFDGPALFGFSGGALGTTSNGERAVLGWNNLGGVTVPGSINSGNYTKGGEPMMIICDRLANEGHPGDGPHDIQFSGNECGNAANMELLFTDRYVGVLSTADFCGGFRTMVIRNGVQGSNFPGVVWFTTGGGCNPGGYRLRVVYLRK